MSSIAWTEGRVGVRRSVARHGGVAASALLLSGLLTISPGTLARPVAAASLASLAVSPNPSTIVAGTTQAYTALGPDAHGNSLGDVTASTTFTISGVGSCTGAGCTTTVAGDHKITATDGGAKGTATLHVTPAPARTLTATGLPSPRTAGAADPLTVRALDQHGNTATGYLGTVHLASSDPGAVLPADYTFTAADAGVHKFSGLVLKTAGTQSVTVTDTANTALTWLGGGIVVTPADARTLAVAGLASPRAAGAAGTLTVTAQDKYGNTATGYLGTVHLTSSDPGAVLAADDPFTAADAGVHTFSVTLVTPGTQSVRARDTLTATITGLESGIVVTQGLRISGRVTGPGGQPLANVRVMALTANSDSVGPTGTSDRSGAYSLTVLPGDYMVVFHDNSLTYVDGCYFPIAPGHFTINLNCARSVTVTDTDRSGIDVTMTVLNGHVGGQVRGPGGQALAGITVGAGLGMYSFETTTAQDGSYTLAARPGDYTIWFHDPTPAHADGCYGSAGFTTDPNGCLQVSVPPDKILADVTMPAAVHIRGTVTGPGGGALPNIHVSTNAFGLGTTTSQEGVYALAVASGAYTVSFSADESAYIAGCYSAGAPGHLTTDPGACTPVTATDTDVTGILVSMAVSPRISGRVTGPGGQPVANIGVDANSDGFQNWTVTDSTGAYSLAVIPGDYTVSFTDDSSTYVAGCYGSGGFTIDQGDACSPVTVGTSDVPLRVVVMPIGMHIRGLVTGPDGERVQGLAVRADPDPSSTGSFSTESYSGEDGTYVLTVLPGDYWVSFVDESRAYVQACVADGAPGGVTDNLNTCSTVTVAGADITGLDVTLTLSSHISGRVLGPDGNALEGILVKVPGMYGGETSTDINGRYSIPVKAGTYSVTFRDDNGLYVEGCYGSGAFTVDQGACAQLSVPPDRTLDDVTMVAGVQISGHVKGPGPDQQPLAGIAVTATTATYSTGSVTGDDGTFAIAVLPGDFKVSFHDGNEAYFDGCYAAGSDGGYTVDQGACSTVTVSDATADGIDVTMPFSPHIGGHVGGPDGQPLAGIFVGADSDGFSTFTFTDQDGAYRLTVLPGTYTLGFHDDDKVYLGGCYAGDDSTPDPHPVTPDPRLCTPVTVDEFAEAEFDVMMSVARRIVGRVVGPDGLPLANINVNSDSDALLNDTDTDENGRYVLLVVPGQYQVNFRDEGSTYVIGCYGYGGFNAGSGNCAPVSVSGDDVTLDDVTMPVGLHIQGIVREPGGTPLPNISVYASGAGGFGAWSTTGPQGEYSIAVVPGAYTVWFDDERGVYAHGCYSSGSSGSFGGECTSVSLPPDPFEVSVTLSLATLP